MQLREQSKTSYNTRLPNSLPGLQHEVAQWVDAWPGRLGTSVYHVDDMEKIMKNVGEGKK